VLLEGILCLKQGPEPRSILQVDAQDSDPTSFGAEVIRCVEFGPLLGIEEIHQSNVGDGFKRRSQFVQPFFDIAACHALRLYEDAEPAPLLPQGLGQPLGHQPRQRLLLHQV